MNNSKKLLTKEQALQKIKHYCAYQERCHSEVVNKLFQIGAYHSDHDELISTLIEENYLNEERYAQAFCRGKFRMKKWGRTRITYSLKQKQISTYCINKGLKEIDLEEYFQTLSSLATKEYNSLHREQWMIRRKKTTDFLLRKGYELNLINEVLNDLIAQK